MLLCLHFGLVFGLRAPLPGDQSGHKKGRARLRSASDYFVQARILSTATSNLRSPLIRRATSVRLPFIAVTVCTGQFYVLSAAVTLDHSATPRKKKITRENRVLACQVD